MLAGRQDHPRPVQGRRAPDRRHRRGPDQDGLYQRRRRAASSGPASCARSASPPRARARHPRRAFALRDAGARDYELNNWFGLFAPAGVSPVAPGRPRRRGQGALERGDAEVPRRAGRYPLARHAGRLPRLDRRRLEEVRADHPGREYPDGRCARSDRRRPWRRARWWPMPSVSASRSAASRFVDFAPREECGRAMQPNPVKARLAAGHPAFGTMAFEFFTPSLAQIVQGGGRGLHPLRHGAQRRRRRDDEGAVRVLSRDRPPPASCACRRPSTTSSPACSTRVRMGIMVPMVETPRAGRAHRFVHALSPARAARRGVRGRAARRLPPGQRRPTRSPRRTSGRW